MFIPSYHHGIGYEVLQLAGRHGYAGENSPVRGAYNGLGTQPGYEGEAGVDAHLHQEGVESDGRLSLCEIAADIAGDLLEFLSLMFLSHEALHHADAVQVFPDYAVEAVIGLEHAAEYGVRHAGDDHETAEEDGNDDQVWSG